MLEPQVQQQPEARGCAAPTPKLHAQLPQMEELEEREQQQEMLRKHFASMQRVQHLMPAEFQEQIQVLLGMLQEQTAREEQMREQMLQHQIQSRERHRQMQEQVSVMLKMMEPLAL